MNRTKPIALLAILATPLLPLTHAGAASAPAVCLVEFTATVAPGFTLTGGEEGSFTTDADSGTIDCHGTIDSKPITGPGAYVNDGVFSGGPAGASTCAQGGGNGLHTFTVQTSDGPMTISEPYAFGWVGVNGWFRGETFSGLFQFTPVDGDCLSAPLTRVTVHAEGKILR